MKLRIKKSQLSVIFLEICFFIIFVLDYQCFYLFEYPSFMSFLKGNKLELIISAIGFFLTIVCYNNYRYFNAKLYNKLLKYYFICILVWMVLVVYSSILYPLQPISKSIGYHACLMYIGLAIPVLTLFYLKGNADTIFNIMNIIAFIWYVLLIYQRVVYINSGEFIFNFEEIFSSQTRSIERDYGIRISLRSLGNIMILYNFNTVLKHSKKGKAYLFSIIQFIMGLYGIIFIQQTRGMIFVVAISLAVIAIISSNKASKKTIVCSMVIIICGILLYSGVITDFLSSFSLEYSNSERLGTSIRLEAIQYYLKCFVDTIFMGNGFADGLYYESIQQGKEGIFFYSDVGIFGLFGEIGVSAILFYIIPLYRSIKTGIRIYLKRKKTEYSFYIGLVVYLVGTSVTLIITTDTLAVAFPVIIALTEYIYAKVIKECRKENEIL